MKLFSWFKNFCIAGSLLVASSIFPIISSIDVLILNGKRVYIFGDVHEQLPICSMHRKLFFDFLQRLDKKSTHVIIEDSYGQLVSDNPTTDKTSFKKSITDSFLDCLTTSVLKLGYSTRNIEFRNTPIKYWNVEQDTVANRLRIFKNFYVPLFTEHKNIDTDNALLREHYEAKMNLVIDQIETFKNIIIKADVKKYCIKEILLFLLSYSFDAILYKNVWNALKEHDTIVVCVGTAHAYELRLFLQEQGFKATNTPFIEEEIKDYATMFKQFGTIKTFTQFAACDHGCSFLHKSFIEAALNDETQRHIITQLTYLPLTAVLTQHQQPASAS